MQTDRASLAERPLSLVRHDLMASVVVFLVALPLSMGIALASGVPVAAGLITGIVGGILVGALAGCPLQVKRAGCRAGRDRARGRTDARPGDAGFGGDGRGGDFNWPPARCGWVNGFALSRRP